MSDQIGVADLPQLLGITYRQVDFWIRSDLIRSHHVSRTTGNDVHPKFKNNGWEGSGFKRVLDDGEFEVLRLMVDLVNAGMLATPAAALARRLLAEPVGEITVGTLLLAYRPEQVSA